MLLEHVANKKILHANPFPLLESRSNRPEKSTTAEHVRYTRDIQCHGQWSHPSRPQAAIQTTNSLLKYKIERASQNIQRDRLLEPEKKKKNRFRCVLPANESIYNMQRWAFDSHSNKPPEAAPFSNPSMERSSSLGTSWADQWDYGGSSAVVSGKNKKGGGGGIRSSRWKSGVEKTKAVASSGFRKVKEGTVNGFNWIKNKYRQRRRSRKQ